jgi:hypothetical protein
MKSQFDTLVENIMAGHKLQTNVPFLPTRSLSDLKGHREKLMNDFMRLPQGAKKEQIKAKVMRINAEIAKLENPKKRTLTPFDSARGV